MLTFGERLRKARKRKGLSQIDVFNAIGLSNKSLSRYEKGESTPTPETLQKLIRLYDISGEYVLGLTEVMGTSQDGETTSSADGNLIEMIDHKSSARKLSSFIASSPSKFHVVANIARKLLNDGYTELKESADWDIERGGKYFLTRNGSSIVAFKVGSDPKGFNVMASHADSPTFKLKPNAELETLGKYIRLNTERYGGMIMSTWLDRPLSVAGRVTLQQGGRIRTALVNLDEDTLLIPSVAIHMNRNANEGMSYNPQVDTIPLMGSEAAKGKLMSSIAANLGVKESEILSSDMFLYNRTPASVWGNDGEFVSSPKLDDLQCAYATLQGFLAGDNPETVSVYCVFDNEEVGSGTKQGADSDLLRLTTERICLKLQLCKWKMLANSFMVSADNAHAVHPNHPEYADPTNRPFMNGGIVIKHNGNERYATDAVSETIFRRICQAIGVPTQTYANRSDLPGGSTLGNISTAQVSMPTVDIGLAQLAMHSSYETAGAMDTLYLERASAEFYRTAIINHGDGNYELKA